MKTLNLVCLVIGVGAIAAMLVLFNLKRSQNLYNEAEEMVPYVWALASQMESFQEKSGRVPESLSEVAEFSGNHEFYILEKFNPEFNRTRGEIFRVSINSMYGFYISREFMPGWLRNGRIESVSHTEN